MSAHAVTHSALYMGYRPSNNTIERMNQKARGAVTEEKCVMMDCTTKRNLTIKVLTYSLQTFGKPICYQCQLDMEAGATNYD